VRLRGSTPPPPSQVNVKIVDINKNGQFRIMITSEFGVKVAPGKGAGAKGGAR